MVKCKQPTDHYNAIEETVSIDDPLNLPKGLFILPGNIRGKSDYGVRKFLVFYFDNDDDYNTVLKTLQISSKARSHPDLDSKKLARILQKDTKK